jgi:hypothetical protein
LSEENAPEETPPVRMEKPWGTPAAERRREVAKSFTPPV